MVRLLAALVGLLAALASTAAQAGPRALTTAMKRAGLAYKHALTIDGARYRVTDLFDMGGGRLAAITDVERGGSHAQRIFYQSKSQGVFRLLPAVNRSQRNLSGWFGGMPLLDKGDAEEHLTAPVPLQDLLGGLVNGKAKKLAFEELIVPGVPTYRSPKSYARYLRSDARPTSQKLRLFDLVGGVPVIRAGLEPDYARPISAGTTRTKLDGVVEQLRYPSKDGRVVYTLHVDRAGRAQIATVTVAGARIGRFGLPTRTVTTGDVTMPQWEYPFQIPAGAAGALHPKDEAYASSWGWLKTRPEIRAFYEATGRPMPE